jgi:stage II sporulation protein D
MKRTRGVRDFGAMAVLVVVLAAAGCTPAKKAAPEGSGEEPVIRVLIGETRGTIEFSVSGAFRIESAGGMALVRSDDPATISVRREGTSTQIHLEPQGSAAVAEGDVYITPTGNAELRYDGVAWPGRMLVRSADGSASGLWAVNVVGLESYLEGVLPHEIGNPGPDAFSAMEAQAVTARTYAISRISDREGAPFDVYSSVRDQVYRGREKTSQLASSAVRETRGRVLVLKGQLARTYYSATCGGHTSDIRLMWPQREPARYLQGVLDRDDAGTFCSWVYNFRWRFSFSGKELGDLLRRTIPAETGVDPERVGHLIDIAVSARGPSGRARYLEVVTTRGSFTVEGDRIRWVLMPDPEAGRILPSTLFNLHKEMNNQRVASVSIVGGGNGHGVGMCQNGAIEMAKRGYTRDMILSHYYPGTEISKRY